MVARIQIDLAKEHDSLELVKDFINSVDQVPISNCDFVKGSIINIEFTCPIFIFHQHNWTSTRRRTWLDVTFLEFLNLVFDFLIS